MVWTSGVCWGCSVVRPGRPFDGPIMWTRLQRRKHRRRSETCRTRRSSGSAPGWRTDAWLAFRLARTYWAGPCPRPLRRPVPIKVRAKSFRIRGFPLPTKDEGRRHRRAEPHRQRAHDQVTGDLVGKPRSASIDGAKTLEQRVHIVVDERNGGHGQRRDENPADGPDERPTRRAWRLELLRTSTSPVIRPLPAGGLPAAIGRIDRAVEVHREGVPGAHRLPVLEPDGLGQAADTPARLVVRIWDDLGDR